MNLPLQSLIFWPVCVLTVAGAMLCVFARNLLHAAFGLGVSLLGVAGLFLFLQAEYLAAIQVLVYVGGILILLIFGIMLSKDVRGLEQRPRISAWLFSLVIGALVLTSVTRLATATILHAQDNTTSAALSPANTKDPIPKVMLIRSSPDQFQTSITSNSANNNLGDLLMGPYLLPFLVIALLLTVVLIGAVVLVRKELPRPGRGGAA